jgi:hypothetical protein
MTASEPWLSSSPGGRHERIVVKGALASSEEASVLTMMAIGLIVSEASGTSGAIDAQGTSYCFQALNASAKARSPGVPFSMARMARRLLL